MTICHDDVSDVSVGFTFKHKYENQWLTKSDAKASWAFNKNRVKHHHCSRGCFCRYYYTVPGCKWHHKYKMVVVQIPETLASFLYYWKWRCTIYLSMVKVINQSETTWKEQRKAVYELLSVRNMKSVEAVDVVPCSPSSAFWIFQYMQKPWPFTPSRVKLFTDALPLTNLLLS